MSRCARRWRGGARNGSTRLVDAAIVWQEPGAARARLIVIEHGEIITRAWVDPGTAPPVPPGHARRREARHEGFTVARFDRLRVLMTELKRSSPKALRSRCGSASVPL